MKHYEVSAGLRDIAASARERYIVDSEGTLFYTSFEHYFRSLSNISTVESDVLPPIVSVAAGTRETGECYVFAVDENGQVWGGGATQGIYHEEGTLNEGYVQPPLRMYFNLQTHVTSDDPRYADAKFVAVEAAGDSVALLDNKGRVWALGAVVDAVEECAPEAVYDGIIAKITPDYIEGADPDTIAYQPRIAKIRMFDNFIAMIGEGGELLLRPTQNVSLYEGDYPEYLAFQRNSEMDGLYFVVSIHDRHMQYFRGVKDVAVLFSADRDAGDGLMDLGVEFEIVLLMEDGELYTFDKYVEKYELSQNTDDRYFEMQGQEPKGIAALSSASDGGFAALFAEAEKGIAVYQKNYWTQPTNDRKIFLTTEGYGAADIFAYYSGYDTNAGYAAVAVAPAEEMVLSDGGYLSAYPQWDDALRGNEVGMCVAVDLYDATVMSSFQLQDEGHGTALGMVHSSGLQTVNSPEEIDLSNYYAGSTVLVRRVLVEAAGVELPDLAGKELECGTPLASLALPDGWTLQSEGDIATDDNSPITLRYDLSPEQVGQDFSALKEENVLVMKNDDGDYLLYMFNCPTVHDFVERSATQATCSTGARYGYVICKRCGVCYRDTTATERERLSAFPTDFVQISTYRDGTLAIGYNGSVWALGNNTNGRLGIPSENPDVFTEVLKEDGTPFDNAVQVVLSENNAVIVCKDGSVWGAGSNAQNQLGTNAGGADQGYFVPLKIGDTGEPFANAVSAAVSPGSVVIVCNDGTVYGAGNNASGLFGDSRTYTGFLQLPGENGGVFEDAARAFLSWDDDSFLLWGTIL